MPSVLFVCTANICRSPMAMAILRSIVGGRAEKWRIESAGTWAIEGMPSDPKTQNVLSERGLDIRSHRSRAVSKDLVNSFDLILTMEQGHQEALQIEFPSAAEHIYMLSELIGLRQNIGDPIGGTIADFQKTADEIEHLLTDGFETILRLTGCKDQDL